MGKFNKSVASLHQMEEAARRVHYELHKEYYDKLEKATKAAEQQARLEFLTKEIARLKAEIADNTEEKRYCKVGSSDRATANHVYRINSQNGIHTRIKRRRVSYKIVPCVKCFNATVELTEAEKDNYSEVFYIKKYNK